MLLRSNSLTEVTKSRLLDPSNSQQLPAGVSSTGLPTGNNLSAVAGIGTTSAVSKTPAAVPVQNLYESIFIKLFAQITLHLIASFTLFYSLLIVLRDLSGLKLNFLKFSFWFQNLINLSLLIVLVFAKLKVMANNVKDIKFTAPFDFYFNRDQLILLGVWTAASYNFGAWYLRQYAPHIYKMFEYSKGKSNAVPILREQFFLLWATLLCQGLLSWTLSNISSGQYLKAPRKDKIGFYSFFKSRLEDVSNWSGILNRSGSIYGIIIFIHLFSAYFTFPVFGWLISHLIDLHQPIRHSFLSLFRFGIFAHLLILSIILNFIYFLIDCLIEFYFSRTLHTAELAKQESERCLSIGLCRTAHPFIHLQACAEFAEISSESTSVRRRKIFSAIEDEGSISREICDWFTLEMREIGSKAKVSLQDLETLDGILNRGESPLSSLTSDLSILKQQHQFTDHRTGGFVFLESIIKRIFSIKPSATAATDQSTQPSSTSSTHPAIPELFARRGGPAVSAQSSKGTEQNTLPLMFEFGSFLNKNSGGKMIISYWIASRKLYCIDRFDTISIMIPAMAGFVNASFNEDQTGQVQMSLPKVLESMADLHVALENILSLAFTAGTSLKVESEADKKVQLVSNLLKEALKSIVDTFEETLENVRISSKCRDYMRSL